MPSIKQLQKYLDKIPHNAGDLVTITYDGYRNIRNVEEIGDIVGLPAMFLKIYVKSIPIANLDDVLHRPVISLLIEEKVVDLIMCDTPYYFGQNSHKYIISYKQWATIPGFKRDLI